MEWIPASDHLPPPNEEVIVRWPVYPTGRRACWRLHNTGWTLLEEPRECLPRRFLPFEGSEWLKD